MGWQFCKDWFIIDTGRKFLKFSWKNLKTITPSSPLSFCGVLRMGEMWGYSPLSEQLPASSPSPLHSKKGPRCSTTCLGSAAASTATPSIDPAAFHMLFQHMTCVAALDLRSWFSKCAVELRPSTSSAGHRPPPMMSVPRPPHTLTQSCKLPKENKGARAGQMCKGASRRIKGGSPESKSKASP